MVVQIPLYSRNFGRLSGEEAWRQNLDLAMVSASKIESSLGPMGAYKMVNYNRGPERVVKVTKDAVEVLSELEVQYPAVKTLAEAARIQREQVGDGVSTFVIVLDALLQEARRLVTRGVHPTVVLRGYHEAAKEALAVIDEAALPLHDDITAQVIKIVDCGRGCLSGALAEALSSAAARARGEGGIDLKRIRMIKESGGSVADSALFKGVVIKKSRAHPGMPESVAAAKVALVSKKLDARPLELLMKGKGPFNMKLQISNGGDLGRFKGAEDSLRDDITDALVASGAKVLFCRSKIAPHIADGLSRRGILAFELVDQGDLECLAQAAGGFVVGDVDDIRESDLGLATSVEVRKVDGIDHAFVEAGRGSTLVIRGSSSRDDSERLVKSAITLLRRAQHDPRTIPGGGAVFMHVAKRLRDRSSDFPGREQVAVRAFADAMEKVPLCLVRNYGLDRSLVMTELRGHHANGRSSMGVTGSGPARMDEARVEELACVAKLVIHRAYEVAALLLRIDDYFCVKELPLVHKR